MVYNLHLFINLVQLRCRGVIRMKKLKIQSYDLDITLTPFINIVGVIGSGKTMLLRTLINQVHSNDVYLDDKAVSEYDTLFLRKNVAAVLNNFEFKTSYVKEELLYYQLKIDIDEKQAYKNITNFVKFFELEDIIESKIEMLSKYEQAYLKILSLLIIKPRILGIDDMLTYLNINQKLKIIKFVKNNKITILNCTTNPEELLFGTDIIILDHKRVVAYEKSEVILSSNKYLSKIGMKEPFIVELSANLNYYDLLRKKFFDMKTLVGELWK